MQNAPIVGDIRLVISRDANGKIRKIDGDQFTVQFNAPEYDGDEVGPGL